MARYTYDAYAAQQEARKSANPNSSLGPEVHFLTNYLKNDGDVVVVRFPYHSMDDLMFETTHTVTFPGKRYPSRVRCSGDESCPFCAQGVKLDIRFFAKLLLYVVDETSGEVKALNAVWDRPAAFADIDIKNLIAEYGDISNYLFKIKRNGIGTATRYTISIVMNNTVYNPAIYKADFTELVKVDPARILSKSIDQYNEALNPGSTQKPAMQTVAPQPAVTPAMTQTAAYNPTPANTYVPPVNNTVPQQPVYNQTPTATSQQPSAEQHTTTEPRRPTTRYQF